MVYDPRQLLRALCSTVTEANVRWELGEEEIGVTACAWVHLYGGASRRAGGELAGAPIR